MCRHVTHASFGPLECTTQMPSRSVQPFLHSSRHSYSWQWTLLSPKIARSHAWPWPHLIHDLMGPPESSTQASSRSLQPFLQNNRKMSIYFTMGCTFPSKLPFPMGDLWTPSNTWFLGLPESSTQTTSRPVQPFLQGSLVWQTDRQTDRQTDQQTMLLGV